MDKAKYLSELCGFEVVIGSYKNQTTYEFRLDGIPYGKFYTYPKAKAFARGIQLGKSLA